MVKTNIIIDSSAIISLVKSSDSTHYQALEIVTSLNENYNLICPNEIFSEAVNILGKKLNKETAYKTGKNLLSSSQITFPETTIQLKETALNKFRKLINAISYTDCLVMAYADHFKTKSIFGFDEHFKTNGYVRLGID